MASTSLVCALDDQQEAVLGSDSAGATLLPQADGSGVPISTVYDGTDDEMASPQSGAHTGFLPVDQKEGKKDELDGMTSPIEHDLEKLTVPGRELKTAASVAPDGMGALGASELQDEETEKLFVAARSNDTAVPDGEPVFPTSPTSATANDGDDEKDKEVTGAQGGKTITDVPQGPFDPRI